MTAASPEAQNPAYRSTSAPLRERRMAQLGSHARPLLGASPSLDDLPAEVLRLPCGRGEWLNLVVMPDHCWVPARALTIYLRRYSGSLAGEANGCAFELCPVIVECQRSAVLFPPGVAWRRFADPLRKINETGFVPGLYVFPRIPLVLPPVPLTRPHLCPYLFVSSFGPYPFSFSLPAPVFFLPFLFHVRLLHFLLPVLSHAYPARAGISALPLPVRAGIWHLPFGVLFALSKFPDDAPGFLSFLYGCHSEVDPDGRSVDVCARYSRPRATTTPGGKPKFGWWTDIFFFSEEFMKKNEMARNIGFRLSEVARTSKLFFTGPLRAGRIKK